MEERLYVIINKTNPNDHYTTKSKTELEAIARFCEERKIETMTIDKFFEKYKTFVATNSRSH